MRTALLALALFVVPFVSMATIEADAFQNSAATPAGPDPTAPSWTDRERESLELSFIAMAGFWHTEPALVRGSVIDLLGKMLPRQEIIWGPALHQPWPELPGEATRLSDALVFISRDLDTGDYNVVFRGTNPISAPEWLFQDFMVQKMVAWRQLVSGPAPLDAQVSQGTATALNVRLELLPGPGFPGAGESFAKALIRILAESTSPCVLRFTGHSLGGLLAPVTALWLQDRLFETGRADLAAKLVVEVCGYAAPSVGNEAFADYLDSRVPGNVRYANDLDVVTRAWNSATLEGLPDLYLPTIVMQGLARSLFDLCLGLARGRSYEHAGRYVRVPARIVPVQDGSYLLEAVYQHALPYLDLLPPERRQRILIEVLEPLAQIVSVRGFAGIDFRSLFEAPR